MTNNKMLSSKDKKSKNKLLKIDMSSGSDNDDSEHELSYYAKDKVKLMKEVLKLIKPKKIKSMAPDCIKNLDIVEINSMLLEELLGISNKRLQYIFNGENVDRETSSSESEEEKQPVDVISLDDISDDDDIELCISQNEKEALEAGVSKKDKYKSHKIKTEPQDIAIKAESSSKPKKDKKKQKKSSEPSKGTENLKESEKDKLMSVLELLELQARARAIRSQLAIETDKKKAGETESAQVELKRETESDSDAIIIDSPQLKEIVITSESEGEDPLNLLLQAGENPGSSNSKHVKSNLEDIQLPPQKKQKTCEKSLAPSNEANEQEAQVKDKSKAVSHEHDQIDMIDLTDTNKTITESELRSRKDKLLSKIQKIKLVRNKNPPSSSNTELNKNQQNTNETSECGNEPTGATCLTSTNEVNVKHLTKDSTENSEEKSEATCAKQEETENKEALDVDANKHAEAVDKPKEVSEKSPKPQNVSYCDNDEIVINLDEDEMDDMEND